MFYISNVHMPEIKHRGILFIVSSPSGAGKTTIIDKFIQQDKNTMVSVSMTTRQPRYNEYHTKDYFFVSKKQFIQYRDNNDMLEYAKVFDHYYGTAKAYIQNNLAKGIDMICNIDWQGMMQIKQKLFNDVITIFILPPSLKELNKRLHKRGTDDCEIIKGRMNTAKNEILHWQEYDYILINYDVEQTVQAFTNIVYASRYKRIRDSNYLRKFVDKLLVENLPNDK